MEIVVVITMLLVWFGFVLKLTCLPKAGALLMCVCAAMFMGMSWDFAINLSKTQIADWIQNLELMLDIAVLLTVDVFLQISFCILWAKKLSSDKLTKCEKVLSVITLWLPGLLIFPVLFSLLVEVIFAFPGVDFATLAWTTAIAFLIVVPLVVFALKWLLPELELRLELIFLVNALVAMLGIVATVNGRTAVAGVSDVQWSALAAVLLIFAGGAVAGLLMFKRKMSKLIIK